MPLRDYQQAAVDRLFEYWGTATQPCIMQLATGCHAPAHPILMADGTVKRADEIEVGDLLMGRDAPRKVVELHRGYQPMYKITPTKGTPFCVNEGHILHVVHYSKHNEHCKTIWEHQEMDISVKEYLGKSNTWKHCTKLVYSGYDYGHDPAVEKFSPYLVGVYLGDGQVFTRAERHPIITNVDKPVLAKCRRCVEDAGWQFGQLKNGFQWSIRSKGKFKEMLFAVGAMSENAFQKQFPKTALSWSRQARLELLAGLLDTDGSNCRRTGIDFIQKNKEIALGVVRLSRSLGFMATMKEAWKNCQTFSAPRRYWRVCISGHGLEKVPMVKHKIRQNWQKKDQMVTGFSVEPVGVGKFYGWTVDGDHLYLDGELMVHHNSGKSHCVAEIINRARVPTLVLQPSKEILEQNYEKLLATGFDPQKVSICSASAGSWRINQFVTFATIGTIAKHYDFCQHIKLVIIDEVDCVPVDRADSQYLKFLNNLSANVRVVGLTATPWRNVVFTSKFANPKIYCRPLTSIHCRDGEATRLGGWVFKKIIYRLGIKDLQDRGFLAKTIYHCAETDWSFVRDVPGRMDYDTNDMMKWIDIEDNTSRFTQAIKWCMDNGLKTIVFTPSIDMNFRLQNVIEQLGGTAECMDSDNDTRKSREQKMQDFRDGKFQFLVNVGMVGRGVDVPNVDAVVLCRPTKSLSLYEQYIGRCLRIDPENPDKPAYILDLSGNVERFGRVEDIKIIPVEATTDNGWKYVKETIIHRPGVDEGGDAKVFDRVS